LNFDFRHSWEWKGYSALLWGYRLQAVIFFLSRTVWGVNDQERGISDDCSDHAIFDFLHMLHYPWRKIDWSQGMIGLLSKENTEKNGNTNLKCSFETILLSRWTRKCCKLMASYNLLGIWRIWFLWGNFCFTWCREICDILKSFWFTQIM